MINDLFRGEARGLISSAKTPDNTTYLGHESVSLLGRLKAHAISFAEEGSAQVPAVIAKSAGTFPFFWYVRDMQKQRATRNRTLTCSTDEVQRFSQGLVRLDGPSSVEDLEGKVINQDLFEAIRYLPKEFADLVILDPPYNLSKNFNGYVFKEREKDAYITYFRRILDAILPALKPNGTLYVCSDWKTSMHIATVLEERLYVRNRITWEREKGRGAKMNWKNSTEDIWFCTREKSDDYIFNVDAVKLKRKVIAPYRDIEGKPKDWSESEDGNHRLTYPSNIWTDITIPFWSMPENTDHPTQKPEKLIAKLVLASTYAGSCVFDPFLGSGTTAVVCKKLGRRFVGIEQNTEYCCWAMKRIDFASFDSSIQGYADGVFWERNSLTDQKSVMLKSASNNGQTEIPAEVKILHSSSLQRTLELNLLETSLGCAEK